MRPCARGRCRKIFTYLCFFPFSDVRYGGRQVVGYDAAGRVLNYSGVAAPTPAEIAADAQKVRAPGYRPLYP